MKILALLFLSIFNILPLANKIDYKPKGSDYDYIESYTVTVDKNDDATMNFKYDVVWNVLESGSENFINFGIPNEHIYNISEVIDFKK